MKAIILARTKRLRRGVFLVPVSGFTLKLFLPHAHTRRRLEWEGNRRAQQDPLWTANVVPLRPIPFGFIMPRGKLADVDSLPAVRDLLWQKLDSLQKNSCESIPAIDLIPPATIQSLHNSEIDKYIIQPLLNTLHNLKVPFSSSHGDIHLSNIIFIDETLLFIDWGFYRNNSTVVLDLLHLALRNQCAATQLSWTEALFFNLPEWEMVAVKLQTDIFRLRALYTMDRISREMEQKTNLAQPLQAKYIRAIKSLVEDTNS